MATTANFVAVFIVLSVACKLASCGSPGLGAPDGCLSSRIEIIPCTQTVSAGANQFLVLDARLSNTDEASSFPTCTTRILRLRDINVSGLTNQVFSINSPGFIQGNGYRANTLVEYNIQCGAGRLAYLDINDINIEGKSSCIDLNKNDANVVSFSNNREQKTSVPKHGASSLYNCVDYFRVIRPSGLGFTESCGTDASENSDELEFGSIQAFFRANGGDRTPGGFEGVVVCFDPAEADLEDCEEVQNMFQRRRKRAKKDRYRLPRKLRNELSAEDLVEQGFAAVRVPHGASATFCNGVIKFTDNLDNQSPINGLPDIPYIKFFKDFDGVSMPRTFIREAKTSEGSIIRFPGPGLLFHKYKSAVFLRFVINPEEMQLPSLQVQTHADYCYTEPLKKIKLQPTEEEREVILQLTGAIQDAFRDNITDFDFTLDPPTINATEPPTISPPTTESTVTTQSNPTQSAPTKKPRYWFTYDRNWRKRKDTDTMEEPDLDKWEDMEAEIDLMSTGSRVRQKRQAATLIFTSDVFELACANRFACNPVLRASANSVIESSGEECPQ